MYRTECPNCGHRLKYGGEIAGKKAKCQRCGTSFHLPVIDEPGETRAIDRIAKGASGDAATKPRYTLTELAESAARVQCPQCGYYDRLPWCQREARCSTCSAALHHPEAQLNKVDIGAKRTQLASRKNLPDLLGYLRKCIGINPADQVALEIVADIGGKEACPVLLNMLQTFKFHNISNNQYQEVPGFQDQLALTLGKLGCQEAIPAIMEFLVSRRDDGTVGEGAIEALGRLRSREAIDLLIHIALNVASHKGYQAARALRHSDPNAAVSAFARALEKCDKWPHDPMLNAVFNCLRLLDTPEARRLTTRSWLDRLPFRRRWLGHLESTFDNDWKLLENYDASA